MANIVAKRFIFDPQQRRFLELDDVIDTGPGANRRKRRSTPTRTPSVEAVERAGWLVGQPVPTPARRHNGGRAALAREMPPVEPVERAGRRKLSPVQRGPSLLLTGVVLNPPWTALWAALSRGKQ